MLSSVVEAAQRRPRDVVDPHRLERASAPASGITGNTRLQRREQVQEVGRRHRRSPTAAARVSSSGAGAQQRLRLPSCCAGSATALGADAERADVHDAAHARRARRPPRAGAAARRARAGSRRSLPCRMATRLTTASCPSDQRGQRAYRRARRPRRSRPSGSELQRAALAPAARRHDDAPHRRARPAVRDQRTADEAGTAEHQQRRPRPAGVPVGSSKRPSHCAHSRPRHGSSLVLRRRGRLARADRGAQPRLQRRRACRPAAPRSTTAFDSTFFT